MKWPGGKTAILVIHGIGQQSPFATLGQFAQGMHDTYIRGGRNVALSHRRMLIPRTEDEPEWVENTVSLSVDDEKSEIDLFEFYWQHWMQRQITFPEVVRWLERTSDGATRYYREVQELADRGVKLPDRLDNLIRAHSEKGVPVFTGGGAIDYLRLLPFVVRAAVKGVSFLCRLFQSAEKPVPLLSLLRPLFGKVTRLIIDYIGDVAVYTTTDVKLKHFEVRDRILRRSLAKLEWILDAGYERVILVGHSLGSVIAYDTLNRLANLAEVDRERKKKAEKLSGLVTFGSPLDKIAFFFYPKLGPAEHVRRQIINWHHGFRSVLGQVSWPEYTMRGAPPAGLDHMKWVNVYDLEDGVSGHLDFYDPLDNFELKMKAGRLGAHTRYWTESSFYERVIDEMF